ncbi:MAG TPA: SAM-dependent methyltransferase [Acidimicrobiales bacterium]|nr:SAM-dependent methyltransferase [Acidimicrobiales bacterium]
MEMALYDPGAGFFATGGAAGREGDFITSPEVGPLFGAVLARALDSWWTGLGRPDRYVVVEAGAGAGTLAAAIRVAAPACAPALHYVMVERSDSLRARQAKAVPLEPPSGGFGAVDPDDEEQPGSASPAQRTGPTFTSLPELPARPFTGVVIANELLDNLPFHLLQRGERWEEVRVGEARGALVEVLVPAPAPLAAEAERLVPAAAEGARLPVQVAAQSWLKQALSLVDRGGVVVIDYADATASMATRPPADWLRTYRSHGRGGDPLQDPGSQDITCEVAVDQLARVRQPDLNRTQFEFLRTHGIGELTAGARATWHERAYLGDLEALKARSRVGEAAALTDPTGLGAFRVLEWTAG